MNSSAAAANQEEAATIAAEFLSSKPSPLLSNLALAPSHERWLVNIEAPASGVGLRVSTSLVLLRRAVSPERRLLRTSGVEAMPLISVGSQKPS